MGFENYGGGEQNDILWPRIKLSKRVVRKFWGSPLTTCLNSLCRTITYIQFGRGSQNGLPLSISLKFFKKAVPIMESRKKEYSHQCQYSKRLPCLQYVIHLLNLPSNPFPSQIKVELLSQSAMTIRSMALLDHPLALGN